MRIGIDARFYNQSGVGRYLRNLIMNLKIVDKKNEYYVFLLPDDFQQFKNTTNFHGVRADFKWYGFAEQFKLPKLLNNFKLDLVHFPHFNVPIFYSGKFVVTIHDLIHQHFQMNRATTLNPLIYKFKHFGYRRVFKSAISKSKKIIVPSKYVANLLINEWGVSKKKIAITYEAVDENLSMIARKLTKNKIEQVMKKFNIKEQYIFYIGNAHPHKNVEALIRVFIALKEKNPYLQLVLAGQDHYFWQKIKKEYQQDSIIFPGEISDEELVAFYKNAKSFISPSLEEGFGIPLIEAMLVGCPVVASNKGSLPEIGGDAAIYFNPGDEGDMIDKIDLVLKSEKLKEDLIRKGNKRVKQFSWKNLACQTLEIYNQCN